MANEFIIRNGFKSLADSEITGSLIATSFTGSLQGTASYATTALSASYFSGSVQNATSSSYALFAEQALSSSYAGTASYLEGSVISASYAATSSYVVNALTASYVTTAQTASYVLNAVSSSYASNSTSASYALTASYALNGGGAAITASGVNGAIQFSSASVFISDASNLKFDDSQNMLALGLGAFAPSARIHSVGFGTTSATYSFKTQNSNGSSYMHFADNGTLTLVGNTSTIGTIANTGARFYNVSSLGGWGSSQINLTGLLDFYSNDGSIAVRINNAYTGIVDATVIGGITAPSSSAMLQIDSTTKGFLPPRMTTTQKTDLASPVAGLVVYDTTTNKLCCYNGTIWNDLF